MWCALFCVAIWPENQLYLFFFFFFFAWEIPPHSNICPYNSHILHLLACFCLVFSKTSFIPSFVFSGCMVAGVRMKAGFIYLHWPPCFCIQDLPHHHHHHPVSPFNGIIYKGRKCNKCPLSDSSCCSVEFPGQSWNIKSSGQYRQEKSSQCFYECLLLCFGWPQQSREWSHWSATHTHKYTRCTHPHTAFMLLFIAVWK